MDMIDIERYLDELPEPRRRRILHFMSVLEATEPGLPRKLWDYGGGVIGFGHYHYRYPTGRAGEFFIIGVSNRKRYVAIYANEVDGGQYLAETFKDRLEGCKIGKSCIEVPDKVTVADDVLADLTRQSAAFFRAEFEKPKVPKTLQIWE
jgi:hypothetical protein